MLMMAKMEALLSSSQLLPETTAFLARLSVQPTLDRAFKIDKLIAGLKAAGLYTNTKIKGLYLHAAHDAQAARQNLIENASNLSVVGSMTFTTDRGYAGDSGSAELSTTGTISATSHCSGVWVNSYASSFGYINAGGTNGFLRSAATGMAGRWGAVSDSLAPTTGLVHGAMSTNDGAANLRFYKNGAPLSTATPGSSSISSGSIHICLGFAARHAVTHWGPDLTTGEIAALYAALNDFLSGIGAA